MGSACFTNTSNYIKKNFYIFTSLSEYYENASSLQENDATYLYDSWPSNTMVDADARMFEMVVIRQDTRSTVNEQSKKYLEIKNNNSIKIKQIDKLFYDEKNTLPTLNYYSERIKNSYKKKYQKERNEYLKKSQSLSNSDIKRLEYNINLRKYLLI